MTIGEAIQGWHDFYVTAGAAAATPDRSDAAPQP